MTTDFRALCAELLDELEYQTNWSTAESLKAKARAALADEPAVPEVVGSEWQPCVKLPITVHVREQRPGEQHVSTREGITPVQSDDLIMLGVDGEEYPIGRELFQRTYRMGSADEPAVPEGREPAAVTGQPRPTEDDVEDAAQCIYEAMRFERVETTPAWSELGNSLAQDTARKAARAVLAHWGNPAPTPPADGEVAELVAEIRHFLAGYQQMRGLDPEHIYSIHRGDKMEAHITVSRLTRAAELLQRQALVPVSVSERLPGPEDCDSHGWCWVLYSAHSTWTLEPPYGQDGMPTGWTHWLPAHALPLPEVGE